MPQGLLVFSFMEESVLRAPYSDIFSNVTVCHFVLCFLYVSHPIS